MSLFGRVLVLWHLSLLLSWALVRSNIMDVDVHRTLGEETRLRGDRFQTDGELPDLIGVDHNGNP